MGVTFRQTKRAYQRPAIELRCFGYGQRGSRGPEFRRPAPRQKHERDEVSYWPSVGAGYQLHRQDEAGPANGSGNVA